MLRFAMALVPVVECEVPYWRGYGLNVYSEPQDERIEPEEHHHGQNLS